MKKQLFLLLSLAAFTTAAYSQIILRPQVGISSHTLTVDFDGTEWQSNPGYQLGADLQIGKKFYVQPGVQFEFVKCAALPKKIEDPMFDFKRTLLRVPLMVGYAFRGTNSKFGIRAFTGPNASFVLGSDSDAGIFDIGKDDLKSAVWGWNGGLGIDLSFLFLDCGYQFGLSDVFENIGNGSKENFFYLNGGVRLRF